MNKTDELVGRLLVYLSVRDSLERGLHEFGLCWEVADITDVWFNTLADMPELLAQKPAIYEKYPYWYTLDAAGNKKRIQALDKAIELVNEQL